MTKRTVPAYLAESNTQPIISGTSMVLLSKHISTSIHCPADQVYTFAADPMNLPQWASGLSGSIRHVDGIWVAESPMGTVEIEFVAPNPFGVLDHTVTLPSGVKVYNPLRVLPNGDGCEIVFTLYRLPEMSDQQFDNDAKLIAMDLATLKALMERPG